MITLGSLGKFENIGVDKKIVEGEQTVTLLNFVDIFNHKYIDSSIPSMSVTASDKKIVSCDVKRGDIFVTPSSETPDDIGHSAVILEDLENTVYSYHIMRFRLNNPDMIAAFYINYLFDTESVKKQIQKKAKGLTRFGLSKDAFASIEIPFPTSEMQESLVHKLDSFISLISKLDEEVELRLLQFEHYRERLLTFENNSNTEIKFISDVAKNYTGLTYKPDNVSDSGTLVLRSSNILDDKLLFEDNVYVQMTIPERATAKKDDILICVRNGSKRLVGKCAMITEEAEGMAFGAFMTVLRAEKNHPKYLYYVWQSDKVRKQYKGDEAMPIAQITSKDFQRIKIPVPSIEEQIRIVSLLDVFETCIRKLEEERDLRQKQYEYYREKLLTFE